VRHPLARCGSHGCKVRYNFNEIDRAIRISSQKSTTSTNDLSQSVRFEAGVASATGAPNHERPGLMSARYLPTVMQSLASTPLPPPGPFRSTLYLSFLQIFGALFSLISTACKHFFNRFESNLRCVVPSFGQEQTNYKCLSLDPCLYIRIASIATPTARISSNLSKGLYLQRTIAETLNESSLH
jgi:hypothetical protein